MSLCNEGPFAKLKNVFRLADWIEKLAGKRSLAYQS
jgi:hypothetical protein